MLRMLLHHSICSGTVLVDLPRTSLTIFTETRFLRIWSVCGCSLKTAHQKVSNRYLGQTTCCSFQVIQNRFGTSDTRPSSEGRQVGELKYCTV